MSEGYLSAFGVTHAEIAKYATAPKHAGRLRQTMHEHPGATKAGEVAAVVAGAKGVRVTNALRAGHALKDTERAARVASGLSRARSAKPDVTDPLGTLARQQRVYRNTRKQVPEARALKSGVNRYSKTFGNAARVKGEANATGRAPNPLLHPRRAEDRLHANNFKRLMAAGDKSHTPDLHRVQFNLKQHKPGDTVDFGHLSSWSTDHDIVHTIKQSHEQMARAKENLHPSLHRFLSKVPAGSHAAVYHLPGGQVKATNISGATGRFAQNEWLTGGKHVVTRVESRGTEMHYHLRPHSDNHLSKSAGTSAFGVTHELSKADRRADRRSRQLSGAAVGTGVAAGYGHLLHHTANELARDSWNAARNSQHAKGQFTPDKARALAPTLKTMNEQLKIARVGRRVGNGALVATAGLAGAAALHEHRRTFGKAAPLSPTQLARRKRVQARLTTTGALIGLGALGASGGKAIAVRRGEKGIKLASRMDTATTQALTVGAGISGVGGLHSASISRAEGRQKLKKSDKLSAFGVEHIAKGRRNTGQASTNPWHLPKHSEGAGIVRQAAVAKPKVPPSGAAIRATLKPIKMIAKADDKALLRQHGLRGAPAGVDRDTRQQIWEARANHLNQKRNRWDRTRKGAKLTESAAGVTAGGVGALVAGHQVREAYKTQHPAEFQRAAERTGHRLMSMKPGSNGQKVAIKVATQAFRGKPGFKTMAMGAGAAGTAAVARRGRIYAGKKTRKYSSASGGIASGTARRMRDYSVNKSAFGVEHVGKALEDSGRRSLAANGPVMIRARAISARAQSRRIPSGTAGRGATEAQLDAHADANAVVRRANRIGTTPFASTPDLRPARKAAVFANRIAAGKKVSVPRIVTRTMLAKSEFGLGERRHKGAYGGNASSKSVFDHRGVSAGAAAMVEPIQGGRGSVVRPKASAERSYQPERNRMRRYPVHTAALAAGSAVAGAGAVRDHRAGRAAQRRAAGHFKAANEAFHRGNKEQVLTSQRIARHGVNVGGKFKAEGLSNNATQFGQTFKHSQAAHDSFHEGFQAQGRQAAETARAARSLRRAKGRGAASVALGAGAVAVHRHRSRGGRSYPGYL